MPSPMWKKIATWVGAIWLVVIGGGAGAVATVWVVKRLLAVPAPESSTTTVLTPQPDVVTAVKSLARLETESFHLERVVDLADQETHLYGLVQAKDSLLLLAAGDVVAGIDLDAFDASHVDADWKARRVHVRLPAPEVFSAALDEKLTRVYSRSTDLLAHRHEDLEARARAEAVKSMEKSAVDGGILERAKKDGDKQIESMLHALGFAEVTIDFEETKENEHGPGKTALVQP